jgi:hypothetical protein
MTGISTAQTETLIAESEPQMTPREIPPGTIAIVSADELARYHYFTLSVMNVAMPQGSRVVWCKGPSVVDNLNGCIATMKGDWLWILGDDHQFEPDILRLLLTRMYDRDLDVLAPLCLMRAYPFAPVIYDERNEEGFHPLDLSGVDRGQPLVEVAGAGTAGMLIRYRVLAAMGDPVFRHGSVKGREGEITEALAEDLVFCDEARDYGFKIHADLSVKLGHVTTSVVWPAWNGEEAGAKLMFGQESVFIPRMVL